MCNRSLEEDTLCGGFVWPKPFENGLLLVWSMYLTTQTRSGLLHLAGLFPFRTEAKGHFALGWQVIVLKSPCDMPKVT